LGSGRKLADGSVGDRHREIHCIPAPPRVDEDRGLLDALKHRPEQRARSAPWIGGHDQKARSLRDYVQQLAILSDSAGE
jgi:hypothetical protein